MKPVTGTAVNFMRAAKVMAKARVAKNPGQFVLGQLREVETMLRKVVGVHNKLLNTKKIKYSSHALLPFVVDETTLLRKKKQPKFVKNMLTRPLNKPLDVASDFLNQAHFFKASRMVRFVA